MANERTEPLQLNLGSLRSAMSLTLHTHHASRIWHGRAPAEGRPGIIGLNGYISVMNKMKRGAEQDDPYSDWWMLRIEDKLADTKTRLQTLREVTMVDYTGVADLKFQVFELLYARFRSQHLARGTARARAWIRAGAAFRIAPADHPHRAR